MKEFISIIIPCYNVELYIEKCIDAILNEDYKNYEIILIDDCSTDNTLKIIKKYEKKYSFIKVLQNEVNSGAGYSRNKALSIAKYDIISFIDSDDYIEKNFHYELLSNMKENNSSISLCDIYIKYDKDFKEQDSRSDAILGDVTKYNAINNGFAASPCNKLFKKELFKNNLFAENIMNEDIPAIIGCIIDAKKISYTKNTYYNYFQRSSSVQNESIAFKRFDLFKAIGILIKRKKIDKEYYDAIIYNQVILFFLYVIPKEKSFFKRYKLLKEYSRLSKPYNIRQNRLFWSFLTSQGRLSKYYYKMLFKLNESGFSFLADLQIELYLFYKNHLKSSVIKPSINLDDLIICAKKQNNKKEKIKLSVIVPNYNYEKFMFERLYSILNQTEKVNEIIILDDCSTDNSRELIDKIVESLSPFVNIKKVYNEQNSGSAFKQWKKGFEEANGDYVWIAEADDYCEKTFLKNVIKPIIDDSEVMLSYSDTAFIDKNGKIILKSIKPEIDILKTKHWDSNYVNNGLDEINNYSYLNCTIANVSSVIFKNDNYKEEFELSGKFKQAGDWLFYVNVIKKGKVAFTNKPLNYYRVHGNNVTSTTKKQAHFNEIKKVHLYLEEKYGFTKDQKKEIKNRYDFLEKVWNLKE